MIRSTRFGLSFMLLLAVFFGWGNLATAADAEFTARYATWGIMAAVSSWPTR